MDRLIPMEPLNELGMTIKIYENVKNDQKKAKCRTLGYQFALKELFYNKIKVSNVIMSTHIAQDEPWPQEYNVSSRCAIENS